MAILKLQSKNLTDGKELLHWFYPGYDPNRIIMSNDMDMPKD